MGRFVKNLFLGLGVLLLSSAILYFLVQNKKAQENMLHTALSTFGDRLLAMIPQDEQKDSVKEKYDEFLQQVQDKEVPPEKIEVVAAEILNAAAGKKTMDVAEAEALIDFALEPPEPPAPTGTTSEPAIAVISDSSGAVKVVLTSPQAWTQLGETLIEMNKFSQVMQKISEFDTSAVKMFAFHVDSGIKIVMDDRMREELRGKRSEALQRLTEEMEKKRQIVFEKGIAYNPRHEQYPIPLEALKTRKYLSPNERKEIFRKYQILDSLWVNHSDSLAADAIEKMRQAGLIPSKLPPKKGN